MRFKDFKLPEQEPTLTKQITDPQKKPSLWSKIKTDFNKGRDITKQTSGSSAGNIIQQVGALGKGVKDTAKGLRPDFKGGAPAKAKPKATQPAQASGGAPRMSTDKMLSPKEVKDGASFVDPESGTQFTWYSTQKKWMPNNKTARPLDLKTGFNQFNLAKQRTKVESIKEGAEARIQHIEDLIFFQGSQGAKRALAQLKQLAKSKDNVQIKWDGSPAVIFGRDDDGKFVLTDKGGFVAKGYDGKTKSPQDLEKMFLNRPGAKNDPKGFKALGANMAKAFPIFEKAVPEDYRGYFKGDILYFNKPNKEQNAFFFKPNIVQYMVKADSELGKKIESSDVGVVIHREVDQEGNESPLSDIDMFKGGRLLVIPPVTVSEAPKVDESSVGQLESLINKNSSSIDSFLNTNKLREMKVSDFPQILYTYVNSKVDSGMQNLGRDFLKWLANSKVSQNKQQKIQQYVKENINTFSAIWDTVTGIQNVKNNIISQLDTQDNDVTASIGNKPGGEGYVLTDPKGDMKLVSRGAGGFAQANRSVQR
tara:strand:- start:6033 stop:7637 length:1605 start_codon:yes stop_codon:yes gene_type:complete